MDHELRRLLDRQEVWDCIQRCARGMDRHDAALIASAYHPDAIDDHGMYRGSAAGFVEHVNGSGDDPGVHATLFRAHQHLVLNHVVDLDGDVAHSETQYLFCGAKRAEPVVQIAGGRYLDRLERREGRWAIAARRVTMEWTADLPGAADMASAGLDRFTCGTWDRTDVSYQRPLEARTS